MNISRLNSLTEVVRAELDCAQEAAKDFRYAMDDWQYAKTRMGELIGRLENVSQSFESLVKDLSDELKLEEAV